MIHYSLTKIHSNVYSYWFWTYHQSTLSSTFTSLINYFALIWFVLFVLFLSFQTHSTQIVKFEILEEQPVGILIGMLIKFIPNQMMHAKNKFVFKKIQKDQAHLFQIDPENGQIRTAQRLDRESLCRYDNTSHGLKFECRLSFSVSVLNQSKTATIMSIVDVMRVHVYLIDIDDNQCTFVPNAFQIIEIPETAHPKTYPLISLHQPEDADAQVNHSLDLSTFRLLATQTNQSLPFKLEIKSTQLLIKPFHVYLRLEHYLDYEYISQYTMYLEANGFNHVDKYKCMLKIQINVLDQNDHVPKFTTNYSHIRISESTPLHIPIYTFSATDADSNPIYQEFMFELDHVHQLDTIQSTFYIDSKNGSLMLKRKLNYQLDQLYHIPVIVFNSHDVDKHWPVQQHTLKHDKALLVIHVIDANDEAPKIIYQSLDGSSQLAIVEHTTKLPLDFGLITVRDPDHDLNGLFECFLTDDRANQQLTISPMTPMQLKIFDTNATLVNMQTKKLANLIGQSEVIYKLSAIQSFDRELVSHIAVDFMCHDFGTPQLTSQLTINIEIKDVNDHKPLFNQSSYKYYPVEDSDPMRKENHFIIGQVHAYDLDEGLNSQLQFKLLNDDSNQFAINDKGILYSKKTLDREMCDYYKLHVLVVDKGQPVSMSNSIEVEIFVQDYNDQIPKFEKDVYKFYVEENNNIDQYLDSIVAVDKDIGLNAIVDFQIEPLFYNDPDFVQIGSQIVNRSDEDHIMDLEYWKMNQTKQNRLLPFELIAYHNIEKNSYELKLFTRSRLDREQFLVINRDFLNQIDYKNVMMDQRPTHQHHPQQQHPLIGYKFWIVAKDQGLVSSQGRALVHVILNDQNDNAPYFVTPAKNNTLIEVSCFEYRDYSIIKILALDDDFGRNGTVQYELSNTWLDVTPSPPIVAKNRFKVNAMTGILQTSYEFTLNEINHIYILHIWAKDFGIPISLKSLLILQIQITNSTPTRSMHNMELTNPSIYSKNSMSWVLVKYSLNFYIIVSTIVISIFLSLVLICLISGLLKYKKNQLKKETRNAMQLDELNHDHTDLHISSACVEYKMLNSKSTTSTLNKSENPNMPNSYLANVNYLVPYDPNLVHYSTTNASVLNYSTPTPLIVELHPIEAPLENIPSPDPTAIYLTTSSSSCQLHPSVCSTSSISVKINQTSPIPSPVFQLTDATLTRQTDSIELTNQMAANKLHASTSSCIGGQLGVQYVYLNQQNKTMIKQNSFSSVDQDSGNGDSLDIATTMSKLNVIYNYPVLNRQKIDNKLLQVSNDANKQNPILFQTYAPITNVNQMESTHANYSTSDISIINP